MEETAFVKVKTQRKKKKRQRNREYLGTGEYGTCILSELGDFSRKQRGTEITGIGTILSLTSQTIKYELMGSSLGAQQLGLQAFIAMAWVQSLSWGTEILQDPQLSNPHTPPQKELLYINYGGTSENHPHSHANISLFHVLEHCRSSRDGGRICGI